jgi:alkylation response protein AidB-like acyl-CoA dehydrogenase
VDVNEILIRPTPAGSASPCPPRTAVPAWALAKLFYTDFDRSRIEVREIDKLGRKAVDSNLLFIDELRVPAAEAAFQSCQTAVMTHGGMGYAREYHVERYLRESMIPRIAPVSPQLILCYIAERVLGLPKSY